jgi:hypothetical protein
VSIKKSFAFLIIAGYFFGGVVQAQCVGNTIDEAVVASQPDNLTLTDLIAKFGKGCFGGMTAMTYQFMGASGKPIWFWLKNEPEPAFAVMQKSVQTQTPPNIGVLVAVKVEGLADGSDEIIWPKSLVGKSFNQVAHDAYFKKVMP